MVARSGVYLLVPLCCYLWETVMVVCEINLVGFDVCSGLVGEGVVGLEAFNEKNVWPIGRWASAG